MLGLREKPVDEKMRQEAEKKRKLLLSRATRLKKLISADSGWKEYCELIQEMIDFRKKSKALTSLDTATPETIYQLKLQDHEIFILTWALRIPQAIMKQASDAIKPEKESNNDQNI